MSVLGETVSIFRKVLVKRSYLTLSVFLGLAVSLNLILGPAMKYVLVLGMLLIIASLSTFYYNYFHSPFNFELVKLSSIVATFAYGLVPGIAMAVAATLFSRLLSSRLNQRAVGSLLGIVAAVGVAYLLQPWGVVAAGMAAVLVYHLINLPLSLSMGDNWGFASVYTLSNVFFNALLISRLAPFLLSVVV
ncbi:MAG: hypothetical protein HY518_01810 [Candidatus Aenigmarchaeota archaeon]|nr:hypothetical protein [Candidatus Aenigmarchaeota archaeon]